MDVQESLRTHLKDILEDARYAPSVHNTQPWQVQAAGDTVDIMIDSRHQLHDGDPTGRETIISLGIFCEALVLAARLYSLDIGKAELAGTHASITFIQGATDPQAGQQIELLKRRCTDRSLFKPATIEHELTETLRSTSDSSEVRVHVITEKNSIDTIASLTSKGIKLALSSPGFRRELSQYLTVPWSRFKRGISTNSLAIFWPVAVLQPIMIRLGWQTTAEAALEKRRWESASAVVVIAADGDMAHFWFETGRVYLRASLAIEAAGLSQATSAAIVEASNYHDDVEELLHTDQRILALIRIGKSGKSRHYSPRVSAEELLTSN